MRAYVDFGCVLDSVLDVRNARFSSDCKVTRRGPCRPEMHDSVPGMIRTDETQNASELSAGSHDSKVEQN